VEKAKIIIDEIETMGGMTKAIVTGMPKLKIEESAARRQARIDSGDEIIVGVNKFTLGTKEDVDVRIIDNVDVLRAQVKSINEVKAKRDPKQVTDALKNLTQCAREDKGNLLDLAIKAARVRVTLGEISEALAIVPGWDRYLPQSPLITGAYAKSHSDIDLIKKCIDKVLNFEREFGRKPRILVAKMGQDGHDRGARVIASGFSDLGFDVDIGPLFQTPSEVVRQAIDADVHVIGISSQAAGHRTLIPQLIQELKAQDASYISVICGGVIPPQDYKLLFDSGCAAIFGPGTKIPEAAMNVVETIAQNLRNTHIL